MFTDFKSEFGFIIFAGIFLAILGRMYDLPALLYLSDFIIVGYFVLLAVYSCLFNFIDSLTKGVYTAFVITFGIWCIPMFFILKFLWKF